MADQVTATQPRSAEIYDAFAEQYRAYSTTKEAYISAVDAQISKHLKGKAEVVVDFGAGDGHRGAKVFQDLGAKTLYQMDISREMVQKCAELGVASDVFDTKEDTWKNSDITADLVMSLWNVLGHVPNTEARIEILRSLKGLLSPTGSLCFDVNNRHYAGYGKWQSLWRRTIDWLNPNFDRGDVEFTWTIDGVDYPASGHFFTLAEVKSLLEASGFYIDHQCSVDYLTGTISDRPQDGQLLIFAKQR